MPSNPQKQTEANRQLAEMRVNILADAFEKMWTSGERPRLETFLGDTNEPERSTLLRALLAIELRWRRESGERPAVDEYVLRFPQHRDLVCGAWSGLQQDASPAGESTLLMSHEDDGAGEDAKGTSVPGASETQFAPSEPFQHAGETFDDYSLLEEVGRGGMGVVYKAYHRALDIAVAIKFLHSDLVQHPEAADRFFREARLAARLNHPGIVRVFDCGKFQEHYFIVMEYVVGQSLREYIDANKQVPVSLALEIVEAVAAALQDALNKVGVIHRDIKPDNILLTPDGAVKLADLGLAKVLADREALACAGATMPGVLLGTPGYMSPEQIADAANVDHRADVFSLGATLYHMLSGRPTFDGESFIAILKQVEEAEPEPLPVPVPVEVEELISKMLAKKATDRFQTYDELIGAVQTARNALSAFEPTNEFKTHALPKESFIPFAKTKGRLVRPASPTENRALLVVDVQNDFCPSGALAVPDGDQVVPIINDLSRRFSHVVVTQDWHCVDHLSFASSHPGKNVLEQIRLSYGYQILWPDHCVQGTPGAEFHPDMDLSHCELIIRKGYHREIDSYSAFFENDRQTPTGLAGYLRERGLTRLFIVGLATDFCVAYSALDAHSLGFEVTVIEKGCRGIDVDGSLDAAWKQMSDAGITRA